MDLNQAATCYYRTVFYTSAINVIAYLITLHHVVKGSKLNFIIALIILLTISNVCAILSNTFARVWVE